MKEDVKAVFEELFVRYPVLESCREDIRCAYDMMHEAYENGHKLLMAGNGGSAVDCEHMAGELMKCFKAERPLRKDLAEKIMEIDPVKGESLVRNLQMPLRAIPLTSHLSITTAYMNDADATGVYAQQLLGYGDKGDVFVGISTSGNSENIISAAIVAKAMGIKVVAMTGEKESRLSKIADISIRVPQTDTFKVQELHLPIYHVLCLMLENTYFGE